MGKWTLRQQRTREIRQGYKQEHTAALRATRYVRRHAWQFHGAGVEDAVQDLATLEEGPSPLEKFIWASQNAREGVASVLAAFEVPAELAFGGPPPVPETAHGLTVVGWKGENGCGYCPEHRPSGATMITTGDLLQTGTVLCLACGTKLGPAVAPSIQPAQCPDCSHAHVEGQNCTAPMGPGFCGCTG